MKIIVTKTETSIINRALCRRGLLWSFGLTAVLASSALQAIGAGAEHYRQVNLVSDVAGAAQLLDPDLVNAWGISFSSTSPFWLSDNGTGKSTQQDRRPNRPTRRLDTTADHPDPTRSTP